MKFKLYTARSTGGEIIELILAHSKLPYEIENIDYETLSTNEAYAQINPLKQIPSLQLSSGEYMTETLAIALYLNDITDLDLVPQKADPSLSKFYRWAVYLVASVYPTFTYSDDPSRWVEGEQAQKTLKTNIDEYRKKLWMNLENAITSSPWFLGEQLTIIDFYLAAMIKWRPRREWFEKNTPKISAIVDCLRQNENLQEVFKRHE